MKFTPMSRNGESYLIDGTPHHSYGMVRLTSEGKFSASVNIPCEGMLLISTWSSLSAAKRAVRNQVKVYGY